MKDNKKNNILEIAKRLISFKTTDNNIKEKISCLNFIDSLFLKKLGSKIKIEKFLVNNYPSRLYFLNRTKKNINLVLNGHIDVVEGNKNQFSPLIKNNKLYGRGSYDMKSAVAVFIDIFLNYPSLLSRKNATLMIVSDEETSGKFGTDHILNYLLEHGYKVNFCINGEPTDLEIVREAKGGMFLKISIQGKSSHSARPWLGKNPFYTLRNLLNRIYKYFPPVKKQEWKTTAEVTEINSTGFGLNTIPDNLNVYLDIRYVPQDKSKTQEFLAKIDNYYDIKILENNHYLPIIFKKEKDEYTRVLEESIKTNGVGVNYRQGYGTSDLRFFAEKEISGVGFGPIGQGAHSSNEFVDINSLKIYKQILLDFVKKI